MRRRLLLTLVLAATLLGLWQPAAEARSHAFEHSVLLRINQARAANGLRPLRPRSALGRVAARHSRFLASLGALQHRSADGSSFSNRILRVMRSRVAGETIALGTTARLVVSAWLASPPHRALLLDRRFRLVGVGARPGWFRGGRVWYVTADLAT